MRTQRTTIKNPHFQELKAKETKFAYAKAAKYLEQKNQKKKIKKRRLDNTGKWEEQILATSNKAINTSNNQKKKYHVNNITYFNYNKKGYYTSIYT